MGGGGTRRRWGRASSGPAPIGPSPPGRPHPTRQLAWAPAPLCSDLAAAQPGWEVGRSSGRSGARAAPGAVSNELRATCAPDDPSPLRPLPTVHLVPGKVTGKSAAPGTAEQVVLRPGCQAGHRLGASGSPCLGGGLGITIEGGSLLGAFSPPPLSPGALSCRSQPPIPAAASFPRPQGQCCFFFFKLLTRRCLLENGGDAFWGGSWDGCSPPRNGLVRLPTAPHVLQRRLPPDPEHPGCGRSLGDPTWACGSWQTFPLSLPSWSVGRGSTCIHPGSRPVGFQGLLPYLWVCVKTGCPLPPPDVI